MGNTPIPPRYTPYRHRHNRHKHREEDAVQDRNYMSRTDDERDVIAPKIEFGIDVLDKAIPDEPVWISFFGPPGSLKTIHCLAAMVRAVENGVRVVYVSTEATEDSLYSQRESLGWELPPDIVVGKLTPTHAKGRDKNFGDYDIVVVDRDSLWFMSRFVGSIFSSTSSRTRKYYGLYSIETLRASLWVALQMVGAFRKERILEPEDIMGKTRIRDAFAKHERYKRGISITDVPAIAIIDSITPVFVGAPSVAGRILSSLRVQFEAPNVSYIITNNVPKSADSEYGSLIGHVVDGRIMLWNEVKHDELQYFGIIMKMRSSNHSRKVHKITIADASVKDVGGEIVSYKKIIWTPVK